MIFDHDDLASGVIFFDDEGKVVKGMNITEFDAVLDGYIPLSDMSGKNASCVHVEFDCNFIIRSLVFFNLLVNTSGDIDKSWHLPLMHLARGASQVGPDLGSGPVKLVCYSQCPNNHIKEQLWNPDFENLKTFKSIRSYIAKNLLAVQFRAKPLSHQPIVTTIVDQSRLEYDVSQRLRKEYSDEFSQNLEQLLQEQRLRISALQDEHVKKTSLLKREYSQRLDRLNKEYRKSKKNLEESRRLNDHFKNTIEGQAEKITGLRDYFEHKLSSVKGDQNEEWQKFKENYKVEISARIEAAVSEYKEMLHMREVELLYRNEQESQLHDEVNRLRVENQELVTGSGDQLLLKMAEKGISLVSYQPGAGHLTLPMADIARYMENPELYTAEQCGVSEQRYNSWLIHFNMPVCDARIDGNTLCGENVERVDDPSDFHLNESNRCCLHRQTKSHSNLRVAGEK